MIKSSVVLLALLFSTALALAQDSDTLAVRAWRQAHEHAIMTEFIDFLKIPDLTTDTAALQKNAVAIQAMFEARGVKTRLLEMPGAPPVVYGEILTPGATRTLLFYAHYDGQPLDPKEWASPPFEPTLRDGEVEKGAKVIPLPATNQPFGPEWRLYARAAGDDKVSIMAFIGALDALKGNRAQLKSNIKFIMEGEEESDSAHLARILAANKERLRADVCFICDGPVHQTRRQQVVFGVRGIQKVDITVYGARRELHSGHYGGWAPNPAMMLAQLLASMKDDSGRILIDHFYDGSEPFGEVERQAIAETPRYDEQLKREFGIDRTEGNGTSLLELYAFPALNIHGMASSRVGAQASNVVPSTAVVLLDLRLTKGIDKQAAVQRLADHIRKQGYFIVDKDPDDQTRLTQPKIAKLVVDPAGYNAARTSMALPISREVIQVVERAHPNLIKLPTLGASIPLYMIEEVLAVPMIVVPIANHDDNQHSYNENIRLQNLWDGIETYAALMRM
jgi:acetylornithine deacetylase/succinyl-diaminopimelate desuccinylase-like protein